MDGNNSSRFLAKIEELRSQEWFPRELDMIVDTLLAFREIKDSCFGWDLKEGWELKIETFTTKYRELQTYTESALSITLTVTWKIHSLVCHLPTFLSRQQCGMAKFAEQTGESVHAKFKPTLDRHKRKLSHPDHGTRQHRAVVEFSSNNM